MSVSESALESTLPLGSGLHAVQSPAEAGAKPIRLSTILLVALSVHFPLMLMGLPINSYDANYHMFFAAHYARHWFSPWNEKWYAGFSQTTYPGLPQQWIGLFSHLIGLKFAYLLVQLVVILLIPVAVYRFAQLWVDKRTASYAAFGSIFLGALSFLVYQAGQLSTTTAAPLYLIALPYVYWWLRSGGTRSLLKAVVLITAAAVSHHVTLIFAAPLFTLPVVWLAIRDRRREGRNSILPLLSRAGLLALTAGAAIAITLYPYLRELLHNPIKQVPIPHQSRLNFLLHLEWGINYWVIPYGALILALPYIFYKGLSQPRLRPLFFGFWLTFMLGLGGTTPIPRWLLGRAWEVLTFERFTLWASVMALPIVAVGAVNLIDRFKRKALVGLWAAAIGTCALAVAWTTFHPISFEPWFNVDPVIAFLNRENHSQYRFLTLGFGPQMAKVATYAKTGTVDGDYNSARLLPELTQSGAAQLNSAKYFGTSGMDALRAMLKHANQYGLRYIFVRDKWYEPLLVFAGWRKTEAYDNGLITLWSKDDVPPAHHIVVDPEAMPTVLEGIMWGILPIGSSVLALWLLIVLPDRAHLAEDALAAGSRTHVLSFPARGVSYALLLLFTFFTLAAVTMGISGTGPKVSPTTPDGAVHELINRLQARDYDGAYAQLGNRNELSRASFLRDVSGDRQDLLTYSNLQSGDTRVLHRDSDTALVRTTLEWSTAVGAFRQSQDLKVARHGEQWRVSWPVKPEPALPPQVIPESGVNWEVIYRGPGDDWGTQDVDAPRVNIIAMNAIEYGASVLILGEIENQDTVPAFVSVSATLLDKSGRTLAEESSFDKISHILLPKAVTPFRIDFPGISLKQVDNIRMRSSGLLVSASANPSIGVIHQTITNSGGHRVLQGELVNEGGKVVNIPHVLLAYHDNVGKLQWVADAYVPHALLPNVPVPFGVPLRDDLLPNVSNYRVTVNSYIVERF